MMTWKHARHTLICRTGWLVAVVCCLSVPVRGAAPAAPTGVTAVSVESGITVSWATPIAAADHVLVVRDTSPSMGGFAPANGTTYTPGQVLSTTGIVVKVGSADPMSFTDTPLTPGTTYYYAVYAFSDTWEYSGSMMATATYTGTGGGEPATPTGFTAMADIPNAAIVLAWTTPVATGENVLIARATSPWASNPATNGTTYAVGQAFGPGSVVKVGAASPITYADTTISAGQTYYYFICAYDNNQTYSTGFMTASATLTTGGTVAAPTGFMATSVAASTDIVLSWATPAAAGDNVLILRSTTPWTMNPAVNGTTYAVGQTLAGGRVLRVGSALPMSQTDIGLIAGTTYYYLICAYDAARTYSPHMGASAVSGGGSTTLTAPTGFMATAVAASNDIVLSWATPSATGDNVLILRSTTPWTVNPAANGTTYTTGQTLGGGTVLRAGSALPLSQIDTGLTAGMTYHYLICAYDAARTYSPYMGASAVSGGGSTTLMAPTGFMATGMPTSADIVLSWVTPAAAADNVLILRSTAPWTVNPAVNGTTYATGQTLGGGRVVYVGSALPMSQVDTGLTVGTTYYYLICAYDTALTYSTHMGASAVSGGGSTTLIAPTGFMATAMPTSADIVLSWATPAAAADNVLILRSTTPWTFNPAVNGTTYTSGQTLGGGRVVRAGSALPMSQTDTGLTIGTTYYYLICSYDTARMYSPHMGASAVSGGGSTTLMPPTGFMATSSATAAGVLLSWVTPASAAEKVLIARSPVPWTVNPTVRGTTYGVGSAIGASGVVVYLGAALPMSFMDLQVATGTMPYYLIVTVSGTSYSTGYESASVIVGGGTMTDAPTPAGFTAAAAGSTVALSWTAPVAPSANVIIIRSQSTTAAPFVPTDGVRYFVGQAAGSAGLVVKTGTAFPPTWMDTVPLAGATYQYTIYGYNAGYAYSSGLTASVVAEGTAAIPEIMSPTEAEATVGEPFAYGIFASNIPTSFAAAGLPGWLTINRATGVLSGAPAAAGEYVMTIAASNAAGTGKATLRIRSTGDVVSGGDLLLTATPAEGMAPLSTVLSVSVPPTSPLAAMGIPVRYEWDFNGNGAVDAVSFAGAISRVYREAGDFCAGVTAYWANGVSARGAVLISATAGGTATLATLSVSPATGTAPFVATLTATVAEAPETVAAYEWDFDGDGMPDAMTTTSSVSHVYVEPGNHVPSVRVRNATGLVSAPAVAEVVVEAPIGLQCVLIAPQDGLTVGGTSVTLVAQTLGGTGTALEFQYCPVDSETWISVSGISKSRGDHWSIAWDTTGLVSGARYRLRAVAQDAGPELASSEEITVTIADSETAAMSETAESGWRILRQMLDPDAENRLMLGGRVSVTIPFGAMSLSGTLTASLPEDDPSGTARRREWAGTGVVGVELASEDIELTNNFALALAYVDDDNNGIVDGSETPVGALNAYYRGSAASPWENIPIVAIETADKTVHINDFRMGEYVLASSVPEGDSESDPVMLLEGSVSVSGTVFRAGDTHTLTVTLSAANASAVDVYLAIQLPTGDLLCLGSNFALGLGVEPLLHNWVPVSVGDITVFSLVLPELPVGNYTWHLLLTESGSDWSTPDEWLLYRTAPWSFAP